MIALCMMIDEMREFLENPSPLIGRLLHDEWNRNVEKLQKQYNEKRREYEESDDDN